MSYTHSCIKCREKYDSEDDDAYYCTKCNEVRLAIAREVDSKHSVVREPIMSELQIFDMIARSKGGKGNNFVNIKDLGIKI